MTQAHLPSALSNLRHAYPQLLTSAPGSISQRNRDEPV